MSILSAPEHERLFTLSYDGTTGMKESYCFSDFSITLRPYFSAECSIISMLSSQLLILQFLKQVSGMRGTVTLSHLAGGLNIYISVIPLTIQKPSSLSNFLF